MEVLTEQNLDRYQLEQQMDVNSVMLLQEMSCTDDYYLRQRLFEQAADQEASLISEVLEGAVITDFSFHVCDGKLYLLQPNGVTDWQQMHKHGKARAVARAAEDLNFGPYIDIAEAELEESRMQEAMVEAGVPAVMVKLSLCGEDVMDATHLKQLGRDPDLKRAYLRTSVFDGTQMYIHSRSIDGVNLLDGRSIANGWGLWEEPQMAISPDASSVDILKSKLYFGQSDMSLEEMHRLADKLVGAFDALQTRRTGKLYKAGRSPEGVDTYKFVLSNQDLLNAHMSSLVDLAARQELPIGHVAATTNDLRYDIMASFKQRLEGTWVEYDSLAESVAAAGDSEREIGTQFGGCDTVIGSQTAGIAGYINGYGNKGSEILSKFSSKWCPNCLPTPKPGKEVQAWRKGLEIGCYNCGHIEDVCSGTVKQGRNMSQSSRSIEQMDIIDALSTDLQKYDQQDKLKRLQQEAELATSA